MKSENAPELPLPTYSRSPSTPIPTGTPVSLDDQILNDIKTLTPGTDVASIDQDIENSNFEAASQELDAFDKELKAF